MERAHILKTLTATKYFIFSACMVGTIIVLISQVHALPTPYGNNVYEYVEVENPYSGDNNSWWTAKNDAAASVYNGVSGHLATTTSAEENAFLIDLVALSGYTYTGFTGAWLGGKAPDGWLDGPEAGQSFTYVNWAGSEPNNSGYAYMSIGTGFGTPGQWADDSGLQGYPSLSPLDPVIGYFIEYENANPVPEPATMLLFGISLAVLAGSKISKKK